MARTAGQQGDRHGANASCLDDKGRKNKMQEKTRTLSSKSWETHSASLHFPTGEGGSSGTRGQEEAFSPGHPACYQETCWGGCHRAGCRKRETQDAVPGPCRCQGLPQRTGHWQTENHSDAAAGRVPMATGGSPATPHPFSSWTKLSIWSLWVMYSLDGRGWERGGGMGVQHPQEGVEMWQEVWFS